MRARKQSWWDAKAFAGCEALTDEQRHEVANVSRAFNNVAAAHTEALDRFVARTLLRVFLRRQFPGRRTRMLSPMGQCWRHGQLGFVVAF